MSRDTALRRNERVGSGDGRDGCDAERGARRQPGLAQSANLSAGWHGCVPLTGKLGSDFAHVGLGSPNLSLLHLALAGRTQGPVSGAKSIVHPIDDRVAADGTSFTHVAVQLRDQLGSIVPGKTVALAANPASGVVISPPTAVTSVSNGVALFEVRTASVQNVTFTATDVTDGIVLTGTATVQFIVPPAASGGINAFPTAVANNGTATTTITVTLQDANNNPSPGKQIALSQGNGHSIISGPTPPVTDASGQIQFTATNRYDEAVTYTAVDVTDGNLPIPGSADGYLQRTSDELVRRADARRGARLRDHVVRDGFLRRSVQLQQRQLRLRGRLQSRVRRERQRADLELPHR